MLNKFSKTKIVASGGSVTLFFNGTSIGLEIRDSKNILVSYMQFPDSYSGLQYSKRVYNGLQ